MDFSLHKNSKLTEKGASFWSRTSRQHLLPTQRAGPQDRECNNRWDGRRQLWQHLLSMSIHVCVRQKHTVVVVVVAVVVSDTASCVYVHSTPESTQPRPIKMHSRDPEAWECACHSWFSGNPLSCLVQVEPQPADANASSLHQHQRKCDDCKPPISSTLVDEIRYPKNLDSQSVLGLSV